MFFWKLRFGNKKSPPVKVAMNGRDQIKGRTKYERTNNCRATVKIGNNKMWEKISGGETVWMTGI